MELALIQNKIHEIRGHKVMLDYDLAGLYEVQTKVLNQAVKRNITRFPPEFMFRLTLKDLRNMRSQIVTASQRKRNKRITPYAFTEHGVAMLASVLNSEKAIQMNIEIIKAFIALRHASLDYQDLADQIMAIRRTVTNHNEQLSQIYQAIENLSHDKEERLSWKERERIGFMK